LGVYAFRPLNDQHLRSLLLHAHRPAGSRAVRRHSQLCRARRDRHREIRAVIPPSTRSNHDRAELVALRRLGTVEDCAKVVEFPGDRLCPSLISAIGGSLPALAAVGTGYSLFGDATYVSPGHNSNRAVQLVSNATTGVYSGIDFAVPANLTINELNTLSTDYEFTAASCAIGSPRLGITLASNPNAAIFVYIGPPPNYTGCPLNVWANTGNLLTSASLVAGCGKNQSWGAICRIMTRNSSYSCRYPVPGRFISSISPVLAVSGQIPGVATPPPAPASSAGRDCRPWPSG
jgi:hypothetical protein